VAFHGPQLRPMREGHIGSRGEVLARECWSARANCRRGRGARARNATILEGLTGKDRPTVPSPGELRPCLWNQFWWARLLYARAQLTDRTGGIIVLALCVNGWSVDKCADSFEQLAKLAFQPRPSPSIPIISPMVDFLVSFFADGRYSAVNLEAALQDTFGHDRSILDCSRATATGTRIGLPVTTIRDVSTCVFTNYNGVGVRPSGCGKTLFRL
jgi:hypothetical protein